MGEVERIRDVELAKVGEWGISTGDWTVTREDLRSAVEAHRAGVLRKPVIKLGHVDDRFDGQPAFGHIENLRLAHGGDTLVGDLVMPAWLAAAAPMHYPDRSVEALQGFRAADGRTWPLVLTGVALLGATAPGIDTLTSLQDLVAASTARITLRPRTPARNTHTVLVAAARRRRATRKAP
ncbi:MULTISPECIES: hypothetical protein [Gordonia]|uniref:hypothetical protein n=1 Tax=Gordonia TaxID=2053 RepID=UPI0033991BE0